MKLSHWSPVFSGSGAKISGKSGEGLGYLMVRADIYLKPKLNFFKRPSFHILFSQETVDDIAFIIDKLT